MPTTPTTALIDPKDVQGLVRFGYARLTEACYLLLKIRQPAAARAWCATIAVDTAELLSHAPETAIQLAFTSIGLRELGVPAKVLSGFSDEFLIGLAGDENRSKRLGDLGTSAPEKWSWGAPTNVPHLVVMLFAAPGKLEGWRQVVQSGDFNSAFEVIACLDTSDMKGHEPFGFTDGVSQPAIDWDQTRTDVSETVTYTNVVAAGEFLLGYSNEYGKYTDRPLVDAGEKGAASLPEALDVPGKKDLGRNGSFVVMRTLEQDVRGFWSFIDTQTQSDPAARKRLAEWMVGRSIDGTPLAQTSATPIEGIDSGPKGDSNRFTFAQDSDGTRCPFGAHIRRANPRTTDYPNSPGSLVSRIWSKLGFSSFGMRTDIMASTRFHRVLRRGREYGTPITPDEASKSPGQDDSKRGLHFLCINANIGRQFEFIQNAWLMSTKFDGLAQESDPLLGSRMPIGDGRTTSNFTVPQEQGVRKCIEGLPRFITVKGGAYFFLPGISALRYFGGLGE